MGNTLKVRGTNLSNAGTPAAETYIQKDTNELFVGDGLLQLLD